MSRSKKKVAGYTDRNTFMKRYSNRVVRQKNKVCIQHIDIEDYEFVEDIPDRNSYTKVCNPWNICDWEWLFFTETELKMCFVDYGCREIDDTMAEQKYINGRHNYRSK